MRKILCPAGVALLLCYMLLFPSEAAEASGQGVLLWFQTLLPGLLPYMILSNLLLSIASRQDSPAGRRPDLMGAYALGIGLLCGCPMGAKVTADLVRQRQITVRKARYLLTFCNQLSPVFLGQYVFGTILGGSRTVLLYLIFYSSVVLTALTFRPILRKSRSDPADEIPRAGIVHAKPSGRESLPDLLDNAIMDALEAMAKLGGYVILFSLLTGALLALSPAAQPAAAAAPLLEITAGLSCLAHTFPASPTLSVAVMAYTAFGGLSALAQTKGMLKGTPLNVWTILCGKAVHAVYCALLTFLFFFVIH